MTDAYDDLSDEIAQIAADLDAMEASRAVLSEELETMKDIKDRLIFLRIMLDTVEE